MAEIIGANLRYYEYAGMSCEQASQAAAALIERDGWFKSLDRLGALREIMLAPRIPVPPEELYGQEMWKS